MMITNEYIQKCSYFNGNQHFKLQVKTVKLENKTADWRVSPSKRINHKPLNRQNQPTWVPPRRCIQ